MKIISYKGKDVGECTYAWNKQYPEKLFFVARLFDDQYLDDELRAYLSSSGTHAVVTPKRYEILPKCP